MEGYAAAAELLTKMQNAARHYREVYEKLHDDDGAAIRRVEVMLDQASAAAHEENARMNALISEVKREVMLEEQLLCQLKSGEVEVVDIERLQKLLDQSREYERELEEQMRVLKEELNGLENGFKTVESKKEELRKLEDSQQHNHNELALYAQVSRVIPDLRSNSSNICGSIMDRQRRLEKEFQLDPSSKSDFEICRSFWHLEM